MENTNINSKMSNSNTKQVYEQKYNNSSKNNDGNQNKEELQRFSSAEIKHNLKKLFFNYGQFSVKESMFFISFQNTLKILKVTGVLDSGLIKSPIIDLLFKKINSKNPRFNEKQFLDFIVLLIEKIAPDLFKKSRKLAIEAFYKDFVLPYCNEIDSKKVSTEEINSGAFLYKAIDDFLLEARVLDFHGLILSDIVLVLFDIYKVYFHYETNSYSDIAKVIDGTLENLLSFANDFEIVPYNISYNHLVVYYNIIVSKIFTDKQIETENVNINENIENIDNEEFNNTNNNKNNKNNILEFGEIVRSAETEFVPNKTNERFETFTNQTKSDIQNLQIQKLINVSKEKLNTGKVFKFKHFLEMIIHLSEISFLRLVYSAYSDMNAVERFLVFLEKLQSSKGFQNFEKKTNRPHTLTTTLVPDKKTLMLIDPKIVENFKFGDPEVHLLKEKAKEIKNIHKNGSDEFYNIRKVMSINDENLEILESKLALLKDIFISYTGFSDKLSFMKLNYSAFLKFLKDSGLVENSKEANLLRDKYGKSSIKTISSSPTKNYSYRKSIMNFSDTKKGKLTETDASLIFQTLTGPKNKHVDYSKDELLNKDSIDMNIKKSSLQGMVIDRKTQVKKSSNINRLDFFLFIKSFEMLAMKFYPSSKLNYAFKEFLSVDMKGILDNRKNVSVLYSQEMIHAIKALKQESIVVIIQMLHDVMLPMYQNYCDNSGYMSFEQLFVFYKDFNIFPEIINLIQLKNIFFVLSESLANDVKQQQQSKIENSNLSDSEKNSEKRKVSINRRNLFKNEFINFPLFLESLAFSAMFFRFEGEFSDVDKLLYMIERMNHSNGVNKSQMKSGKTYGTSNDLSAFTDLMREKYPDFYAKKTINPKKNTDGFDTIFGDA